jgi:mono/diheme cytochrome c family protein
MALSARTRTARSTSVKLARWAAGAGLAVALAPAAAAIQAPPPQGSAVEGRQLFRTYCASCHGTSARGDGPMVQYLRIPPSNLTTLAAANKGLFPAEAIHRAIDGRRAVKAHGDSAMPIWGDAFTPPESRAAERIGSLVAYLESIQERSGDE